MDQPKGQMAPNQPAQAAVEPPKASRFGIWGQASKKLRSWWEKNIKSPIIQASKKLRSWWEKNIKLSIITAIVAVGLLIVIAFALAVHLFGWDWTGFVGGESKITITSTSKGITTAKELQPAKALWDWLLLLSSVATTSAIVAAGLWFIINRSLAQEAQVSLSLKNVVIVNHLLVAIVEVRFKNLGRTRIKKLQFLYDAKPIDVEPNSERISLISEAPLYKPSFDPIFDDRLHVIEPNEEKSWDIAFALSKPTFFRVIMRAVEEEKRRYWESVAVFNVDDKAKVPTQSL